MIQAKHFVGSAREQRERSKERKLLLGQKDQKSVAVNTAGRGNDFMGSIIEAERLSKLVM